MKVTLDQDKCVASGQCVVAADDVFDQDDDGIAVLLDPTPPSDRARVLLRVQPSEPDGTSEASVRAPRPGDGRIERPGSTVGRTR
ncbi:ferredoxin [[Kitasatospora] papulosa]|uniref:ferredoxin n=1 Tax=[Kitasatospora] papulosa TaxID=1464011 RepID=UPI0036BF261C